jgi:hypothetical protein
MQRWQIAELRPLRIVSFDAAGQPSGLYQVWYGEEKLVEVPIQFQKQTPTND